MDEAWKRDQGCGVDEISSTPTRPTPTPAHIGHHIKSENVNQFSERFTERLLSKRTGIFESVFDVKVFQSSNIEIQWPPVGRTTRE